ncbi:MAG: dockerin type I domain-containing protein, partial [Candidatus Wolfebacteria bacterium]|nr:dockerin type I domain-containing protein [Candidatus Wolfebacteria bacterium]
FDPMLRVSTNPYDVLREMEFSSLSAAIINSEARRRYDSAWNIPPNVPAGDNWITVEARDRQGVPLEACDVWAFSVWPGRDAKIVAKSITDQNGMFLFEWGGVALKGNSLNGGDEKQRLVKVHCDGFMPQAQWLTVFDLQAARYVSGGGAEGDFHYSGKLSFVMPDVVDGGVLSLPVVSFQGDMDGNGCVNIIDLVTIARKFGQQVEAGAKEDVSGDGVVNIIDLVTVARDFGKGACRAAYVPPHTSGSIGFASVLKSIFWVIGD